MKYTTQDEDKRRNLPGANIARSNVRRETRSEFLDRMTNPDASALGEKEKGNPTGATPWAGSYRGRLVVAPPGAGKTTLSQSAENVEDADDLMAEYFGYPKGTWWVSTELRSLVAALTVQASMRKITADKVIVVGALEPSFIPKAVPVEVAIPDEQELRKWISARGKPTDEYILEHLVENIRSLRDFALKRKLVVHSDIRAAVKAAATAIQLTPEGGNRKNLPTDRPDPEESFPNSSNPGSLEDIKLQIDEEKFGRRATTKRSPGDPASVGVTFVSMKTSEPVNAMAKVGETGISTVERLAKDHLDDDVSVKVMDKLRGVTKDV